MQSTTWTCSSILQTRNDKGTYVGILFNNFSSVFDTIIPKLLFSKLLQLSASPAACRWIKASRQAGHTAGAVGRNHLIHTHNQHLWDSSSWELQSPCTWSGRPTSTFYFILKKAQQRMHFLWLLRKHGLSLELLTQFHTAVTEYVMPSLSGLVLLKRTPFICNEQLGLPRCSSVATLYTHEDLHAARTKTVTLCQFWSSLHPWHKASQLPHTRSS